MEKFYYKGKEIYGAKNDIVFKRLFGCEEGKRILKPFLNSALGLNISDAKDITLYNTEMAGENTTDKLSRLDVRAKTNNNEHIDIEIQLLKKEDMEKRSLYYLSKMIVSNLESGDKYDKLGKIIGLNILDYNHFEDENWEHKCQLVDVNTGKKITDALEMNFVELKKLPKEIKLDDERKEAIDWFSFIKADNGEDLEMIVNTNKDVNINEAIVLLEKINGDKKLINEIEARRSAELDYNSDMAAAEKRGREEGKITAVKGMLLKNMSIKDIADISDLSEEKILEIKKEIEQEQTI